MADWITRGVDALGYWGVAGLMFLENVFPPIPSELIMPLAGFGAARGRFTLLGVILAGTVGSVLGQYPLYFLGRLLGEQRLRAFVDRWGRWLLVGGTDVDRALGWFVRHGGSAVMLCRLVPGVRSLISIPAGLRRMNLASFTLYSAVGMGVWASILATSGYLLGDQYERVEQWVGPIAYIVFGALGVAFVAWVARRIVRRHPL